MDLSKILALSVNCDFEGQAWRSTYTCDPSQNLFDDLVPLENQDRIHDLVEKSKPSNEKMAKSNKEKPFLYLPEVQSLISWPPEPWTRGRWGDGSRFAVWYGALTERTCLLEVIFHLRKKAEQDFLDSPKTTQVVFHRQVLQANIKSSLLADLRPCYKDFADQLGSNDYKLCNEIGHLIWEKGFHGLFSKSIRDINGDNLGLFEKSVIIADKKIRIVRVCFGRNGSLKVTHREDITEFLFGPA